MDQNLLARIYDAGECMRIALVQGDVEGFFQLLNERGTLLDELRESPQPPETDGAWKEQGRALARQHHEILQAAEACTRRVQETLTEIGRFRDASRSYAQPSRRPHILNEDLRV